MNLYKKKYLYANGSSVTAGGGFEPIEKRTDVRPFYEQKGIKLPDTQIECSYPYFIAKKLNLELINEAKSGSGIDRLIRTTLDWILANEDIVDQTIFILEPQVGIRLDWYVFEWQDYGVLNAHRNGQGEYPFTLVKEYFEDDVEEQIDWNLKYKSAIDGYFSNFYDPDEQYKSEFKRLILFLEFLNSRKIDYLVSMPSHLDFGLYEQFKKVIPKKCNLFYAFKEAIAKASPNGWATTGPTCVWEYARYSEILIYNETDSEDNHIGYKGNQIVADIITDYIRYNNFIKYYSDKHSYNLDGNIYVKNLSIKFDRVENVEDADFIYLGDMNIFNYEHVLRHSGVFHNIVGYSDTFQKMEDYVKSVDETWSWLREINKKGKRFFIKLFHERVFTTTFIHFLDFMEKEYGIKSSQIWYLDCNITDYPCTNTVPLELKLRSFAALDASEGIVDVDVFNKPDDNFRNKKLISLNNKVTFNRLLVFDRILKEYNDHNLLRKENIISMREDGGVNVPSNEPLFSRNLKNDIRRYADIQLPWYIDSWTRETQQVNASEVLLDIINYHRQCIFSITNETERQLYYEYDMTRDYELLKEIQFSEKCIVPILGGVFPFIITDGLFYRNMEKIGFHLVQH